MIVTAASHGSAGPVVGTVDDNRVARTLALKPSLRETLPALLPTTNSGAIITASDASLWDSCVSPLDLQLAAANAETGRRVIWPVLAPTSGGVLLDVRVLPRASRAGLAGTRNDALLVRLNAPPVDGAANAELIEVIAGVLGVSKRAVSIAAGERSRRKTIRVTGLSVDEARSRLQRRLN